MRCIFSPGNWLFITELETQVVFFEKCPMGWVIRRGPSLGSLGYGYHKLGDKVGNREKLHPKIARRL